MVFIYHLIAVMLLVLFSAFVGWHACDYLKYDNGNWAGLTIAILLLMFMATCVALGI